MFFDQFSNFLEYCDSLPGKTLLIGDFNFHFVNVENNSRKLHNTINMFNLTQSVSEPTHNQGHLRRTPLQSGGRRGPSTQADPNLNPNPGGARSAILASSPAGRSQVSVSSSMSMLLS